MKRRNFIALIAAAPLCKMKDGSFWFTPYHSTQRLYGIPDPIYFDEEVPERMFQVKT